MTTFVLSLSHLVSSGLTIRDALEVGRTTFDKELLRILSAELEEQIIKGSSLTVAVGKVSYKLPPIVISLLRIGERIGSLSEILPRLAVYLQETKRIRDKVRGALIYPILVLAVAFLGMIGVSLFVLPKMAQVFTAIGSGAPDSIEATLNAASVTAVVLPIVAGLFVLVVVLTLGLRRVIPGLDRAIDSLSLKIPILNRFVVNRESLLFCFAMEVLSEGGVTMADGMAEAQTVVSNSEYSEAIRLARTDLMNGIPVSEAFSKRAAIPTRMKAWMAIGERTGRIQQVFAQLRSYYQYELERWADRFVSLIEPILILAVGIVMLCLVVFFVVPLFSSMGNLVF